MTDQITIPRALLEQAIAALTHEGHFPWSDKQYFVEALKAELAKPDRRTLQAIGEHPAPCARHCEAVAFQNEIRALKAGLDSALKNEKRYLWLKSRSNEEGRDGGWTGLFSFYPVPSWDDTPYAKKHGGGFNFRGDLDAAIDAAIAKAEGRTE